MAKVMVSFPDDLLGALDEEAKRRHTSRSAICRLAPAASWGCCAASARLLSELDGFAREWRGPTNAARLVRAERLRDG
jgi:predicted transcriptional regulator